MVDIVVTLSPSPSPAGDYGCIVNGQLSVNRDLIGGNKGLMMKMYIGTYAIIETTVVDILHHHLLPPLPPPSPLPFSSPGFQKQYGHRDEVTKFLEQATLLRGLDHPNIHSLFRVSVEDNFNPLVVYPIVEYGNLHQFLILCRMTPNDSPLSVSHMIVTWSWCGGRLGVDCMIFVSNSFIFNSLTVQSTLLLLVSGQGSDLVTTDFDF